MDDVPKFHQIKVFEGHNAIQRILSEGYIDEREAVLINQFVEELRARQHIGDSRTRKILFTLAAWGKFIPCNFRDAVIEDLYHGINAMTRGESQRGTVYSQNTQRDLITILKQYYTWLIDKDYSKIRGSELKKIKTIPAKHMTKEASDLLTAAEIQAMILACKNSHDRLLITMLYEGGFRIGEIAGLTWHNVKADQYGLVVNCDFKTQKPRYIRLVMSKEPFMKWKSDYPFTPKGDGIIFINSKQVPWQYPALAKRLRRIGAAAKIEKRITPHLFRHSRITHLINEGVNESVIKLIMWGDINTPMFQTYAHLTGKDIDREILKRYGIQQGREDPEVCVSLEPIQCPECQEVCGPGINHCPVCGNALTDTAKAAQKQKVDELLDDARNSAIYEYIQKKQDEMKAEILRELSQQ